MRFSKHIDGMGWLRSVRGTQQRDTISGSNGCRGNVVSWLLLSKSLVFTLWVSSVNHCMGLYSSRTCAFSHYIWGVMKKFVDWRDKILTMQHKNVIFCKLALVAEYTSSEFRRNYIPLWLLFRKWGMKGDCLRKLWVSGKEDPLKRPYVTLINIHKYECQQQNQPRKKFFRDSLMN